MCYVHPFQLYNCDECVSAEAQDCAKSHGAIMIETSAKSAINVASLFVEIGKFGSDQPGKGYRGLSKH